MRTIGLILVICGVIALAYGGFTYTRKRDTVSVGPLSATVEQRESVPIPPIAGGIAIVAGLLLIIAGNRRRS